MRLPEISISKIRIWSGTIFFWFKYWDTIWYDSFVDRKNNFRTRRIQVVYNLITCHSSESINCSPLISINTFALRSFSVFSTFQVQKTTRFCIKKIDKLSVNAALLLWRYKKWFHIFLEIFFHTMFFSCAIPSQFLYKE